MGFDDLWMCIIGMVIVTGIAYMLFSPTIIAQHGTNVVWICISVSAIYTAIYWIGCRWIVLFYRKRFPKADQTRKRLSYTATSILIAVLVIELAGNLVKAVSLFRTGNYGGTVELLLYNIIFTLVLCFMVIALYESIYFFVKYRQNSVEREKLARSQMQSQLSMLRQQVNPHFLFNSLNTLSSLIPEDHEKAGLFTQRLSAVYRRLTSTRHEETVSLGEEVKALEDYIFLLESRFEDKLKVSIDIPSHYLISQIPPLTLQLLLENVVKHNAIYSKNPMQVRIRASGERISMSNNRHARLRKQDSTGLGLENIRLRYELLTKVQVEVIASEDHFEVSLPIIWNKQYEQQATA